MRVKVKKMLNSVPSVCFVMNHRYANIMLSITDPNLSDRFASAMEEIHNKQLETYADTVEKTAELSQSHRQFVKLALGKIQVICNFKLYNGMPLFFYVIENTLCDMT